MLDMELKIHKTFNDTMEQYVEVVKTIEEEMGAVRQLQEKQGNILVAFESSVQELKELIEDKIGGEDQLVLVSSLILKYPYWCRSYKSCTSVHGTPWREYRGGSRLWYCTTRGWIQIDHHGV